MNDVQSDPMPAPQVIALVESMLSTARIDGVHVQEEALIRRFYDEQRQPGMPDYEAVVGAAGQDAGLLAKVGSDAEFAEQLVLMCLMTGYADGRLSDAEHRHVLALAQPLGVSDDRVGELLVQVKDSLIGSLAHLPDPESVAALAKTL